VLVRARDVGRTVGAKFILTRSAEAFAMMCPTLYVLKASLGDPKIFSRVIPDKGKKKRLRRNVLNIQVTNPARPKR